MRIGRCLTLLAFCFASCGLLFGGATNLGSSLSIGDPLLSNRTEGDHGENHWTSPNGGLQLSPDWLWRPNGFSFSDGHAIQPPWITSEHPAYPTSTDEGRGGDRVGDGDYYKLLVGDRLEVGTNANHSWGPSILHLLHQTDFGVENFFVGDAVQRGQITSRLFDSGLPSHGREYFAETILGHGVQDGGLGLYPSISNKPGFGLPTKPRGTNGPISGDVSWGFQWDASIPVSNSFHVPLNKSSFLTSVPEPSIVVMVSLALLVLVASVRRRGG